MTPGCCHDQNYVCWKCRRWKNQRETSICQKNNVFIFPHLSGLIFLQRDVVHFVNGVALKCIKTRKRFVRCNRNAIMSLSKNISLLTPSVVIGDGANQPLSQWSLYIRQQTWLHEVIYHQKTACDLYEKDVISSLFPTAKANLFQNNDRPISATFVCQTAVQCDIVTFCRIYLHSVSSDECLITQIFRLVGLNTQVADGNETI